MSTTTSLDGFTIYKTPLKNGRLVTAMACPTKGYGSSDCFRGEARIKSTSGLRGEMVRVGHKQDPRNGTIQGRSG